MAVSTMDNLTEAIGSQHAQQDSVLTKFATGYGLAVSYA